MLYCKGNFIYYVRLFRLFNSGGLFIFIFILNNTVSALFPDGHGSKTSPRSQHPAAHAQGIVEGRQSARDQGNDWCRRERMGRSDGVVVS